MREKYTVPAVLASVIMLAGCVDVGVMRSTHGKTVLKAFESTVEDATKGVEQGLVAVKIRTEQARSQPLGMISFGDAFSSSAGALNGIIVTKAGHVLLPKALKPETTKRIEIWIGEKEYSGKFVKADEQLGMSILKIDTEDPLSPVDLSKCADLRIGQWGIMIEAGDDTSDYKKLKRMTSCSSTVDNFYRQFIIDNDGVAGSYSSASRPDGGLLIDGQGNIAAIRQGGKLLSMTDLHDDIQELITEATTEKKQDDEAKKKAWLGMMTKAINKEYALSKNLPSSSLWVLYVAEGSPAEAAGVKKGDLVTEFNGKPLRLKGARVELYFSKAVRPKENKPFTLAVLRDGARKELSGVFTKKPEDETLRAQDLGLTVKKIASEDLFLFNLSPKEGLLIKDVEKGSPAATSGSFRQSLLYPNDVIVEMAGQPTPTLKEFSKVLESIRDNKPDVVLIKYYRGIATGYAALNLSKNNK